LIKSTSGVTVLKTLLSEVGCRRLSEASRRLTSQTKGVKADFTVEGQQNTRQPSDEILKNNLNTALTEKGLPPVRSVADMKLNNLAANTPASSETTSRSQLVVPGFSVSLMIVAVGIAGFGL